MSKHKLFTIGFTGKSAESFFSLLKESGASGLIDIRLNRTSQLSGFAKQKDLEFFLPQLLNFGYVVDESLAPCKDLLAKYRKGLISWDQFEKSYLATLTESKQLEKIDLEAFHNKVLLCSEAAPEMCHRRLVAEQIKRLDNSFEIIHLV